MKKIFFVFSAPSGAGKTTLVRYLLKRFPSFRFSVSYTSRPLRGQEVNGVDYHFVKAEEFRDLIQKDFFVEWEEVYPDHFYGTPKQTVLECMASNTVLLLDLDVRGGLEFKKKFPSQTLAIFVGVSGLAVLEERLRKRGTDSDSKIQTRLAKAALETQSAPEFDALLINDDLEKASEELLQIMANSGYHP
ncbi:MAG: guanylate kinase [Bacteroidetes bacterium]|nr:guanylate kinase [Bacteroidota bacterium]